MADFLTALRCQSADLLAGDLTFRQLAILGFVVDWDGPLFCVIARELGLSKPVVWRAVRRLEVLGLVGREPFQDRRTFRVMPTLAGAELWNRLK